MATRQTLPVLPLRGTVIFPGLTAPIAAGRPGTLRAIESALKGERLVFAVAQRDNTDEPAPDILYSMGVIARIGQIQRGLGGVQLLLQGEQRATSLQFNTTEGFLSAVVMPVEEMKPVNENDPAFVALHKELRERAAELGERRGLPEEVVHQVLDAVTDPGRFADLVAGYIEVQPPEKQGLLETLSVEERLRRVLVQVQKQIGMLEAQEEIKSQVQEELGERQREMYLREQMKAIQKELGDGDESKEISDLREKLDKLELPKEARQEVERELGRLERSGRESMEAQVIRTYLEWVAELPWNERSDDNLDLGRAQTVLDEDHYGLPDVKDRVLEFLAVRQLRAAQLEDELKQTGEMSIAKLKATKEDATPQLAGIHAGERQITDAKEAKARAMAKGPILLFVGPPGVGKTSIAKSIARSLGKQYVRVSLGGARDEADIRGHRRTYVGAMPGRIIQGMKQAGTKNPVFLLDEVDKLGVSFQGDPASALLEVLDPAQNDNFTDHYLGVPFDLSEVLFIATANFLQNIPGPLLDRMEVVEFAGYTEKEKAEIAKKYLIPRQIEESGLAGKNVALSDDAVAAIISKYTREAGVRQLERQVGAVARKVARKIAAGETTMIADGKIDAEEVRDAARASARTPGACRRGERGRRRHGHVLHARGRRHHVRRGVDPPHVRRGPALDRRGAHAGERMGERVAHPHGPARRRDEGVGARRHDVRGDARVEAPDPRGSPRIDRGAHPRSGGRDSEGRPVGRRHDGDGARERDVGTRGPQGRGDDGRDHAPWPRAADRRREGEGARRPSGGDLHDHPPEGQRGGHGGHPGGRAQPAQVPLRCHARRGVRPRARAAGRAADVLADA